MTVHHYESNYRWTDAVNFDKFDEGDVVIAPDPQERLGQPTFCVSEIDAPNAGERVLQRGLFWKVEEARRYAKVLNGYGRTEEAER